MLLRTGILACLLAFSSAAAQFLTPETIDWERVRGSQPADVTLKLSLPKATYHQGEIIDATLTYRNTSAAPYYTWTGASDRSGRIPDIAFIARGADGPALPDPLRWYFERGMMGGGGGNFGELGEWSITLPANQWLRFDQPGEYTLFAYSDRVKKGTPYDQVDWLKKRVELVSDPVTITITALEPGAERRIIEECSPLLSSDGKSAQAAAKRLRFLGTPASRAVLFPYLKGPYPQSFEAMMAYYAAPDPTAEAPGVLEAVRSQKLGFDFNISSFYVTLKTAGFRPFGPTQEENEKRMRDFQAASKAAANEIAEAVAKTTGEKGATYYQVLLQTLFQNPEKRDEARAKLAKVQLDLTPEQADMLFNAWQDFGREDFLPLVRKSVGAPSYNPNALVALARSQPEEAREIIVEDLQREPPRYLIPMAVPHIANKPLLSLPVKPLPELEAYFRKQLAAESPARPELLLEAVDHYGTPALLPDVIKFYSARNDWACDPQAAVLRFWLRCDATGGMEAVERALASRKSTGCFRDLLKNVFGPQWTDAALPIITAALDDPNPDVVDSAIEVLEAHADASHLARCVAALQQLAPQATKQNMNAYYAMGRGAQRLLHSNRWKMDDATRQELAGLARMPLK